MAAAAATTGETRARSARHSLHLTYIVYLNARTHATATPRINTHTCTDHILGCSFFYVVCVCAVVTLASTSFAVRDRPLPVCRVVRERSRAFVFTTSPRTLYAHINSPRDKGLHGDDDDGERATGRSFVRTQRGAGVQFISESAAFTSV